MFCYAGTKQAHPSLPLPTAPDTHVQISSPFSSPASPPPPQEKHTPPTSLRATSGWAARRFMYRSSAERRSATNSELLRALPSALRWGRAGRKLGAAAESGQQGL